MATTCLTTLTLLLLTPRGLSTGYHDYDGDYYYDSVDEHEPPSFTARPQAFTVEVGQSVIIPCDVHNIGSNSLVIKKTAASGREKLMFVGREKVTRDQRITLDGHRLHISHARPRDAGTFTCMFDLVPPVQLLHTLDVQYAPTVRALGRPEMHVARGGSVTLECEAQGNPQPIIRWSRQEGPLPSGRRMEEASSLAVAHVDRPVEGTYLCTADNGIGEAAVAAMTLIVEYPPEVSAIKSIVRTGEGDRVELVCLVQGRPVPEVTWHREGHPVEDTDLMDTKLYRGGHEGHDEGRDEGLQAAHVHTLTIPHVRESDFGAYMCIAKNAHGQTEAPIQMTGLPSPPRITSSPNGGESNTYTLTWQTESFYPITEYLIKYRRPVLGVWQTNHSMVVGGAWQTVTQILTHDEPKGVQVLHTGEFELPGYHGGDSAQFEVMRDRGGDFEASRSHAGTSQFGQRYNGAESGHFDVMHTIDTSHFDARRGNQGQFDEQGHQGQFDVLHGPGVRVEGGGQRNTIHTLGYTLRGLDVATDYAAQVRVRNKYGWSSESTTFSFSTKKTMAVLQSTSGVASTAHTTRYPATPLLLLALLLVLRNGVAWR